MCEQLEERGGVCVSNKGRQGKLRAMEQVLMTAFLLSLVTLWCRVNYIEHAGYLTVEVAPSCWRHTASI